MPIIAMTAHALKGDREKCLEAGMDGFVSKPIHPESLFEELSKHKISTPEPARTEPVGPVPAPRIGVIDGPDLLNRVGGDAELLTELLSVFRVDCRLQLHVLHEAIAAGEAEAVERRAHCLKGTLANLAAVRGRELAGELEQMGRSRSLEGAAEKSAELEQEITLVEQALAELCQEVVK